MRVIDQSIDGVAKTVAEVLEKKKHRARDYPYIYISYSGSLS